MFDEIVRRFRMLMGQSRFERELDEEMRLHIDLRQERFQQELGQYPAARANTMEQPTLTPGWFSGRLEIRRLTRFVKKKASGGLERGIY